jgi:isopentenyl-diphosphate delta-isomerase type 1
MSHCSDRHDVCDESDRVVGVATRGEIHQRRLMHRAVHVFVFNSKGELYVQRRSNSKDRFPGLLDSSAAGHVDAGESYERAAQRELMEELGLSVALREITKIQASRITDWEHVVLWDAVTDATPRPDPDEIQSGSFVARAALEQLMATNPLDFVPAFLFLWKVYWDLRS